MSDFTEAAGAGCIATLISLPINALMALWGGWMLMLAAGVVHAEWIPQLPTVGYWWAVLIVFLLQGAFKTVDTGGDK